jgi:hypothetical protein
MATFLEMLFKEAGDECILTRSSVINKFNEAGVPLTWARLASMNTLFEKKCCVPPLALNEKATIVVPLKSAEENL